MIIHRASAIRLAMPVALLTLAACAPVVNIAGANFPAWLLCAIVGAAIAATFRPVFVATGLDPHLGPRLLIYPCLMVVCGCIVYLIFFSRT
jgi:YtcA-like protein